MNISFTLNQVLRGIPRSLSETTLPQTKIWKLEIFQLNRYIQEYK